MLFYRVSPKRGQKGRVLGLLGEAAVIANCERLVDLHAWPPTKLDVDGWLANFSGGERTFAAHLLNNFMFFSDRTVEALFSAAFHGVSNSLRAGWPPFSSGMHVWNSFLDSVIITFAQGEIANVTDSGHIFARKARKMFDIPQVRVMDPDKALAKILRGFRGPVVFVDDFVGSGEQFVSTWTRARNLDGVGLHSFAELATLTPPADNHIFYCTAIMTERGYKRLGSDCSAVMLSAGNIIPGNFSLVAADSVLWPDSFRQDGINFIQTVSQRIGLPSDGSEDDWRGFDKLGLGLAFEDSTPDATIPLFHWSKQWTPLVRRS
jgi:hypothetical protein